ncbi:GIY-YIG nuclease family protein [bacterium]|nr:GIY-YIG nuclease family protein [bacterium]
MHYVYVLHSKKDKQLYVGCTNNLKKRFTLHNAGKVLSTRLRTPLTLAHYEAFISEKDAFLREKWLKTGWGRNQLRTMLPESLKILAGI